MTALVDDFTSTGKKLFFHQEAMKNLQNGKGQPITTHVMLCDHCQHSCSFCSVQTRGEDSLAYDDVLAYLDILLRYSLRGVILSGGGNPILYKCKKTGKNFNDIVSAIHERGLEIGLITNGLAMRKFGFPTANGEVTIRESWATVRPETLDKLTWIRVSMSGLDHPENEVYIPDIDPSKTTLGLSYVFADIYDEPADPHHGKVSTQGDLITLDRSKLTPTRWASERIPELTRQIRHYIDIHKPTYCRILPNCLEPNMIQQRCEQLQLMANEINDGIGEVCFVQNKPPAAPNVCLLGFPHPVLSTDSFVYPCDSVTLAAAEIGYREGKPNHRFDSPWRICHWSEIASIYDNPIRSLIKDTHASCAGCVFSRQNALLEGVSNGTIHPVQPLEIPLHVNFV